MNKKQKEQLRKKKLAAFGQSAAHKPSKKSVKRKRKALKRKFLAPKKSLINLMEAIKQST